MHPVDAIIASSGRGPAMAQVVTVTPADGRCTVLLADGEVDARLADHLLLPGPTASVAPGNVVALLPIGDTYLVIASVGSTGGSGGTAPSLGTNLLPNPGFEFGGDQPSSWSWLWGGTSDAARDSTAGQSLAGTARLVQRLAEGSATFVSSFTADAMLVDPGTTYRFGAWVKASEVAASLACELRVYTGATASAAIAFGGGSVAVVATVTSPGSAYQQIVGDVTIPAGHSFARAYLRSDANHPTPLTVSWDEAAFQQRITT